MSKHTPTKEEKDRILDAVFEPLNNMRRCVQCNYEWERGRNCLMYKVPICPLCGSLKTIPK